MKPDSGKIKQYLSTVLSLIENGLKNGDRITLQIHSVTKKFTSTTSKFSFPSLKPEVNHKFAVYFRVLRLIHNQISLNESVSKRQIYYMDVSLFKKQSVVDQCIDNLANSIGVFIEHLNVHASQKGLVYANLAFDSFKASRESGCSLIPYVKTSAQKNDIKVLFNNKIGETPRSIIILEKDAILSALVNKEKESTSKQFAESILVTGRGFPDRQTKQFVSLICQTFYNTPVFGYFDADIYGFMIAMEYKNKPMDQVLGPCCPTMQIKGGKLSPHIKGENERLDMLPITDRDINLTLSQLSNFGNNKLEKQFTEMQRSLFLCVKRELRIEDINCW